MPRWRGDASSAHAERARLIVRNLLRRQQRRAKEQATHEGKEMFFHKQEWITESTETKLEELMKSGRREARADISRKVA
jgi:hypothetical protein